MSAHDTDDTTHFGFETVQTAEKSGRVRDVFNRVADQYDLMNDVMSAGVHRLWKDSFVDSLNPRSGEKLLDVAGGTGDIAFRAVSHAPGLDVTVCDINGEMLRVGKGRAEDKGFEGVSFAAGDAQCLPFPGQLYDAYTIAFGIRNVTDIDAALRDAHRVLKYGGRFLCLEFSPKVLPALQSLYDRYSFDLIPKMGRWVAGDEDSYAYLVQSIRQFPDPAAFAEKISNAGFSRVSHRAMSGGVVQIHSGWKI